jgi:GntR family transcriptional regulator
MISRSDANPLPLYVRVRQDIRGRVASGEWRPGDRIPTIRELGELHGVSRMTVVQALDELSHEGVLIRWQGKGVFVGPPKVEAPRVALQSFTEETIGRGHIPGSRTLRLSHAAPTPDVRARLGLPPHADVVLLERLRTIDGALVGVQLVYLPRHLVPGLVERHKPIESLYEVLGQTYGILPTAANESYQPIHLDPDQARLLETQPGAPAFLVDRTTTDQHGRTIEFAISVLRGDRYALRLHLRR